MLYRCRGRERCAETIGCFGVACSCSAPPAATRGRPRRRRLRREGGKKRRDKSDKQELTDPRRQAPVAPTATPTRTPVGGTQEDADFERWSQKAKGSPPDPDAAYNAGQYLYNRKRFEEALAMWRVAKAATPDDFDAAKKIVQALNALGRHDEAARGSARCGASSRRPPTSA
ncbi:MAG: tetratricopeptide repeat protein [Polyangiaceae bacterium]|nr:tetratricopeptide repeat protein [Polyangiaceae bacterium]